MGFFSLSCNKPKKSRRKRRKSVGKSRRKSGRRKYGSKKRVSRHRKYGKKGSISKTHSGKDFMTRKGSKYYDRNGHFVKPYSKRRRKSRRVSKRVNKRRSFGKRRRSRRSRRFSSAFSPSLNRIMGNYRPPAMMNTFQEYTGAGTEQRSNHYNNIPTSLKNNFYVNRV